MRRFAILRAAKLKTTVKLQSTSGHNLRRIEVENADQKRAAQNRYVVFSDRGPVTWSKSADGLPDLDELVAARVASIEARGGTVRKDAIKAIELIMTASPGVFRQPEFDITKWAAMSLTWAAQEFGRENILQAALHMDERTPHMHVVVIPETTMRETRGRRPKNAAKAAASPEKPTLAAHKWLDGKAALSAMQDRYADAMAPMGLERGIRHTRTTYRTVREFYGAAEQIEERAERLQQQVAAAVAAVPAPALVNSPAAVRTAKQRQEELAAAATAAAEQARQAERAALLLRLQLETAQAQLDALGGADAAAQIEALRADLARQSEQHQVALVHLERSATAERQRLQRALDELRAERDSAVRDREALRTEMQADIDYWRTHAGEWQAYAESLEPQDDQPSPGPGL